MAGASHGCCVSLLLHGKATHPNYRTFEVTILYFVYLVYPVLLLRIFRDHNPWAVASRSETTAAEAVRNQSLAWKFLDGIFLLRSAGLSLSCRCSTPSTTTSTADQYLHLIGYSRNRTDVRTHTAERILKRVSDREQYSCSAKYRVERVRAQRRAE